MQNPTLTDGPDTSALQDFSARLELNPVVQASLSPAEFQVAVQISRGLSNKEIACVLGKSPATVKAQVASILKKLSTPTRCRLIAWLHEESARARFS